MSLRAAVKAKDPATIGYILGWEVVGQLPHSWARSLFEFGAVKAGRRGETTAQLRRNLSRIVGRDNVTQELVDAAMRSYGRYWAEAFQLPRLSASPGLLAELDRSITGVADLDQSLAEGKGVVLTLPHSGNWDMAGLWLVHHAGTFTTVAERLKPEVLFDAFVKYRQQLGFEVLAHAGGPPPFEQLKDVLARGGVVCLLGERDLKGRGVPVEFFGEPTTFPVGPAELARQTGAALHVADLHFTPEGWGMGVSPRIPVGPLETMVRAIAEGFEQNLRAHPEDWHMLQPLWLADRRTKQRKD